MRLRPSPGLAPALCAAALALGSAAGAQESAPPAAQPAQPADAPRQEAPPASAPAPAPAPVPPAGGIAFLEDPSLTALISQSLKVRPELAAAAANVEAQRQLEPRARALPDPMIEVGLQNDMFSAWTVGTMDNSYVSLMASQTMPWPGRLQASGKLAELAPQQAQKAIARLELSVVAEVQRTWLELVLARDRLALVDRLDEIWKKSAEIARSRYEVGEGAQSDVLRAQLELNRLKQRRWLLQTDIRQRVQALNRLRGAALDTPIETALRLRELSVPPAPSAAAASQDALDRSPERAVATVALSAAEQAVAVARQGFWPDLTFKAGLMIRGFTLEPMWLLSVGSTVPVFAAAKQVRALDEAQARVKAAKSELAGVEELVRLRAEQRLAALGGLLQTIQLYREGLLIQSLATADSTLSQFKVGKVGFLAVLEANAGYIGDEEGYLRAVADAWRLQIAAREVSLAEVPLAGGGAMSTDSLSAGAMGGGGAPGASPGSASPAPAGGASTGM